MLYSLLSIEDDRMRTLIVDDEPHTLQTLRHLCEADENIDEVTVAECGAAALALLNESRPDLLLLDVELRDMTGFDILRALNPGEQPAVIMVAACEEHAAEAIRSGAVDYLTMPIGASRFAAAVEKVQERRGSALRCAQQTGAVSDSQARRARPAYKRFPTRLVAENSQRLYFLPVEDVDYIESCGNYVVIHVGKQKYIRRDTVKRLATELREAGFEWIRRSTLINIARVSFAKKLEHGALAFTLECGVRLVSKSRLKIEELR
jgi:two-component system LytT family response regulator